MSPSEVAELDALQAFMAEALRRRRDLSEDPQIVPLADKVVSATPHFSSSRHLEIYREQFWLRHTQALLEDFPGVSAIVGQAAWEQLVEGYLLAHPPQSFSLRDLGQNLPDFLRDADELARRELVVDMARLEWAHVELFDAPSPPSFDATVLVGLDEQGIAQSRLRLSPALRLLRVSYPVTELKNRLLRGQDSTIILPEPAPATLVLYRQALSIMHHRLRSAPFMLLEALASGATLSEACEVACAASSEAAAEVESGVGAWFEDWVARGFVVALDR